MSGEMVVHKAELELNGKRYEIQVVCRDDGHHYARTCFGDNDIIINDGHSLEEALTKHRDILPVAVTCRQILQQVRHDALGTHYEQ